MFVDEGDYLGVAGRAPSAKKAEAAFKISLARRSSKFSLSSSFIRARSSVVSPGRSPASVPARRTLSKRLEIDRQLRRDRLDGFPLRGLLALVIEDHPNGPLPDLRRIGTPSRFALL